MDTGESGRGRVNELGVRNSDRPSSALEGGAIKCVGRNVPASGLVLDWA